MNRTVSAPGVRVRVRRRLGPRPPTSPPGVFTCPEAFYRRSPLTVLSAAYLNDVPACALPRRFGETKFLPALACWGRWEGAKETEKGVGTPPSWVFRPVIGTPTELGFPLGGATPAAGPALAGLAEKSELGLLVLEGWVMARAALRLGLRFGLRSVHR